MFQDTRVPEERFGSHLILATKAIVVSADLSILKMALFNMSRLLDSAKLKFLVCPLSIRNCNHAVNLRTMRRTPTAI